MFYILLFQLLYCSFLPPNSDFVFTATIATKIRNRLRCACGLMWLFIVWHVERVRLSQWPRTCTPLRTRLTRFDVHSLQCVQVHLERHPKRATGRRVPRHRDLRDMRAVILIRIVRPVGKFISPWKVKRLASVSIFIGHISFARWSTPVLYAFRSQLGRTWTLKGVF